MYIKSIHETFYKPFIKYSLIKENDYVVDDIVIDVNNIFGVQMNGNSDFN